MEGDGGRWKETEGDGGKKEEIAKQILHLELTRGKIKEREEAN